MDAPTLSLSEFRSRIEAVLQPRGSFQPDAVEAARLLLAYAYGLAHDELLEATLQEIDVRAGALLDTLQEDGEAGLELGLGLEGDRAWEAQRAQYQPLQAGPAWAWVETVYAQEEEEENDGKAALPLPTTTKPVSSPAPGAQLKELASSSPRLLDLILQGRHIRSSLHPFNLYRYVFHDLDRRPTFRLLHLLKTAHLPQTRTLLACNAPFASPQWALLTAAAAHPESSARADLEALCAHLLERAHADTTPPRARLRLVSQALALAPPDQLRALLPQWTLVAREVEEALQGGDPYADAASAAVADADADAAARGFGAGLGLGGLPSVVNIGELGAGVRSWGASVGRMVSGVWR
ncbi:hypothetical protein OC844_004199 [Tilletia horrida]|nr:hypothetical protein OC844_004199 [Tilletia horrida]